MHLKHIHCMIEELAGGLKENVTTCMQPEEVGIVGAAVDMLKDLCEAEYYARISKAMEEQEKEDEEEEKYLLKRLKEEYGEEEGERRYYDNYRYANGRFAPKGRGTYIGRGGRKGYMEPPYYHMTPEMYREHDPEYYRDMDRSEGKMYYTEPSMSIGGSNYGTSANRTGSMNGMRDSREGRSGQSRRTYMETKEMRSDNSPESKQAKMRDLEKYMGELSSDLTEMIAGASNEEKTMLKTKLQTLTQKIQ